MDYGKITRPKVLLDSEGSFKQVTETYRSGEKMEKTRYEQRVRVKNETEELAEFVKHKKEHPNNSIGFNVEKGNPKSDYYHVIKIWEE